MMHPAVQIAWHALAETGKHIEQTLLNRAGCSLLNRLHDANSNAIQAGIRSAASLADLSTPEQVMAYHISNLTERSSGS